MAAVKELIRRIRLKDKTNVLSSEEEFNYLHDLLSKIGFLDADIKELYGDRLGQVDWLNEWALHETSTYREEEILHEMSEIEKRDQQIQGLQDKTAEQAQQMAKLEEEIKKLQEETKGLNEEKTRHLDMIAKYENDLGEQTEKISQLEEKSRFDEEKLREYEEKIDNQNQSFIKFKKNVTNQLKVIESLMTKNNNKILGLDGESPSHEEGSELPHEPNSTSSNLDSEDKNPIEMYQKVEEYVKRLLDELKKSKEQNYIYKSQILQNDKINAILNEKIIEYSENACKESNTSKNGKASKKKFLPS